MSNQATGGIAAFGSQRNMAGGGDALSQGDGLLGQALEAAAEQTSEITSETVQQPYEAAMSRYVEAKRDQAERIEDRLENLIEVQTSRLQDVQNHAPGFLAFPGTRVKWQQQVQRQLTTVHQLHARLDIVREIKDGMDMHGSRIEALANHKLRIEQPDLARDWDEVLAAQRRHMLLQREKAREEEARSRLTAGRGQHLGHAQER